MTTKRIGALVLPACLCLLFGTAASAEDKPAESYVYSTYHYCDFAGQDRADEIFEQLQKPASEAAIKDGTITSYGWLAHQTGGKWRRADYFTAGSVQALLDAQKKMNSDDRRRRPRSCSRNSAASAARTRTTSGDAWPETSGRPQEAAQRSRRTTSATRAGSRRPTRSSPARSDRSSTRWSPTES